MTNFSGHLKIGIIVAVVSALIVLLVGFTPAQTTVLAALIVVTSVLPDIDHQDSKPRQYLGYLLLIGSAVGALWLGTVRFQFATVISGFLSSIIGIGYNIASSLSVVLLIIAGLAVAVGSGWILDEYSTHRGGTHSLLFGVVLGIIFAGVIWRVGLGTDYLWLGLVGSVIGVAAHVYIGDR